MHTYIHVHNVIAHTTHVLWHCTRVCIIIHNGASLHTQVMYTMSCTRACIVYTRSPPKFILPDSTMHACTLCNSTWNTKLHRACTCACMVPGAYNIIWACAYCVCRFPHSFSIIALNYDNSDVHIIMLCSCCLLYTDILVCCIFALPNSDQLQAIINYNIACFVYKCINFVNVSAWLLCALHSLSPSKVWVILACLPNHRCILSGPVHITASSLIKYFHSGSYRQ